MFQKETMASFRLSADNPRDRRIQKWIHNLKPYRRSATVKDVLDSHIQKNPQPKESFIPGQQKKRSKTNMKNTPQLAPLPPSLAQEREPTSEVMRKQLHQWVEERVQAAITPELQDPTEFLVQAINGADPELYLSNETKEKCWWSPLQSHHDGIQTGWGTMAEELLSPESAFRKAETASIQIPLPSPTLLNWSDRPAKVEKERRLHNIMRVELAGQKCAVISLTGQDIQRHIDYYRDYATQLVIVERDPTIFQAIVSSLSVTNIPPNLGIMLVPGEFWNTLCHLPFKVGLVNFDGTATYPQDFPCILEEAAKKFAPFTLLRLTFSLRNGKTDVSETLTAPFSLSTHYPTRIYTEKGCTSKNGGGAPTVSFVFTLKAREKANFSTAEPTLNPAEKQKNRRNPAQRDKDWRTLWKTIHTGEETARRSLIEQQGQSKRHVRRIAKAVKLLNSLIELPLSQRQFLALSHWPEEILRQLRDKAATNDPIVLPNGQKIKVAEIEKIRAKRLMQMGQIARKEAP